MRRIKKKSQETKNKNQETRTKNKKPKNKNQETKKKKPKSNSEEPKKKKLKSKNQEPKRRSQKARTKNQETKTKNQEPGNKDPKQKPKLKNMERSTKIYDLEERTAVFAEQVRDFCRVLPKNAANSEYIPQLIRSGSSPGANYIEANESIGDKDFKMKIKTCRRESKEASYWLRLVLTDDSENQEAQRKFLRQEAKEFVLIFTAILKKRE